MTLPIQIAVIGAGVIFALYLLFKERNPSRPIAYDEMGANTPIHIPASYDTHPLHDANNSGATKNDCVICLCDIKDRPTRQLRCKHDFHEECIKTWLQEERVCPICRKFA